MKKRLGIFLAAILLWSSFPGIAFELLPGLAVNYSNFSFIHSIAVGFKYVYFGTTNGVTRFNISQKQWDTPLTGIEGLGHDEIFEIKASFDDEKIWVRTEFGFFEYSGVFNRWDPVTEIPDEIANGRHLESDFNYIPPPGYDYFNTGILADQHNNMFKITDVVDDGWTNLWIGSWGLGALRADNSSRLMQLLNYGLLQDDITAVYSDSGTIWMGGIDTGYIRSGFTAFDWEANDFKFIETNPGYYSLAGSVNDIVANDNKVFFGTDDGLYIYDRKKREITDLLRRSPDIPDARIHSLFLTDNSLYVGTEFGLGIIDILSDSSEILSKTILPSYSILALDSIDNFIWIGTDHGTFRLDISSGKLGHLKLPEVSGGSEIRDIKHSDRKIWLLVNRELKSIDRNSTAIENYPEALQYNDVRSIAVKDTIVAAATDAGLMLLFDGSKDKHFLYTTADGLISNNIRDLAFDGEYIWIGTDQGLTRFWYLHPSLYY